MGNAVLCSEKGRCCGTEPCTMLNLAAVTEVDDGMFGPDPAGAVFAETLEGLNDMDKQLLLFSASNNLAAV
ncbi:unnamed protein product, partial [Polarella glacialis]